MKALERLLNNLLRRDPETLGKLAGLSGKVIRVELLNTAQPITSLHLETHGIRIETGGAGEGDVLIRGTPLNLLAYLRTAGTGRAAVSSNLEIRGDLGLAQEVQRLLRGFEIDPEEQLARLLGDTLARKTANLARAGADFLRQLQHKVELDVSEYALYETETLPDRDEIERFNHAVDELRDDVERLKQRVYRLSSTCLP
ncbi:MAG: SCP2 sterol-binding domain-containing protein [Gammaproteobacteria bacterium]|nr:SCP2 sterol-binding domain-containing protein [Gammaproteobacteria bacterium]MCY4209995.1 SCP2 sterol-binding domain-containing protein [Gammaproteobacteria bacterium]MCY4281983.1 SCP2 sterol-binding domain-containing protein [Gammaproteobacteria bacterium]MCY4338975.1 SCP2 sterol-binding domain-containing protein [Gammaproteobacteria bacterium]